MEKTMPMRHSSLAKVDTKLVFKFDPYGNYSQWRLDDYYESMPERLQNLFHSLGLSSYMNLESTYNFTNHIEKLHIISRENSHLTSDVEEFIEVLQTIDSLREEDTQN